MYLIGGIFIYYSQKNIIDLLHSLTGYSINEITEILNSLGYIVKDKISNSDNSVDLKIFPGMKISSTFSPARRSGEISLSLQAQFSDSFKKEIRNIHKNSL